jgi:type I restriction enzyme S subunit
MTEIIASQSTDQAIPIGWYQSQLAQLCCFENGDRGKNYPTVRRSNGTGRPFVNAGNLDAGRVNTSSIEYIDDAAFDALGGGKFAPGDVLFCLRGSLGKFGLVTDQVGKGAIASSLIIIRPKPNAIDLGFLLAYLGSRHCTDNIEKWSGGAAQPNLGGRELGQFGVLTPPLTEQKRIAQALRDIDDLIASLDALIAKKRDIKQGAMQQLLTGKRRLPGFLGEWQTVEFAKFLPLQRGFDLPNNLLRPGPFPVVYSNGVANWHSKGPCGGPGIVTGRSGTIGKVTYVKDAYWPHNTSLWVTSFSKCHPRFGFHFLVYSDLSRFSSGSGVPTLNRNDFSGWWISVPADLNEQRAIADCLDALVAEIDTLEGKAAKMKAIREGMMQQLLTGRIRLL